MSRDNFQNNLVYKLLTFKDVSKESNYNKENKNNIYNKEGKALYIIIDKTNTEPSKAHVFHKEEVSYDASVSEKENIELMVKEMYSKYCNWLAINRNVIANFYEKKA